MRPPADDMDFDSPLTDTDDSEQIRPRKRARGEDGERAALPDRGSKGRSQHPAAADPPTSIKYEGKMTAKLLEAMLLTLRAQRAKPEDIRLKPIEIARAYSFSSPGDGMKWLTPAAWHRQTRPNPPRALSRMPDFTKERRATLQVLLAELELYNEPLPE